MKHIYCVFGILITILVLSNPVLSKAENQSITGNFEILLYESVFYGTSLSKVNKNIFDSLPEDVRDSIYNYIERNIKFHSQFPIPKSPEDKMGVVKIQTVEKAIVSLIRVDGIENIASKYAKEAKLYYEWEGFSEGPLEEAIFAENFLKTNPETVIKPYLYLFLINRYRCAFECLVFEKKNKEANKAKVKYQQYLKLAKEFPDPLVKLIAKIVDKQKYLYIETKKHP